MIDGETFVAHLKLPDQSTLMRLGKCIYMVDQQASTKQFLISNEYR